MSASDDLPPRYPERLTNKADCSARTLKEIALELLDKYYEAAIDPIFSRGTTQQVPEPLRLEIEAYRKEIERAE